MSYGLHKGLIDCTVIDCEGAGMLFNSNPFLVKRIGERMSDLNKTSPIPFLMAKIREYGGITISPTTTAFDQIEGGAVANKNGFCEIAVIIVNSDDAKEIRNNYLETIIFGVYLIGNSHYEMENLFKVCEIITACSSHSIQKSFEEIALMQDGITVPVFPLTKQGKTPIIEKLIKTNVQFLVKNEQLPVMSQEGPISLT